ncbi:hypothetical protein DFH08DRAFT_825543 [Mycena albidolilacea]|uniref:F-box domain-containing protein n=1 Tax=Mycena albidolilacea TaxID=1033008 RepID=A0AAD7E969_9AGAR|nr:hypothetical protein DFH08DRAFT_825543 [Mycena albidolilacea]
MARRNAPITCLASETLSDIFLYTLPSRPPLIYSPFPAPTFPIPNSSQAPLLLCQISSRFREIAVADPRLWRSLCTEKIVNPQLMEVWLKRAGDISLSLRIARALGPSPQWPLVYINPSILPDSSYISPIQRYLPILLPKISQCRQLQMVDCFIPQFVPPASFLVLESLSVTIQRTNLPAARWLSHALGRAPRLTRFHWSGPAVAAPWAQLSHLSLDVEPFGPGLLKSVLDAATQVQHLRLHFELAIPHLQTTSVLLSVTTFSIVGGSQLAHSIILPNLTHLIIEWAGPTSNADDSDLPSFLQHSQCAITTLEVWELPFWGFPNVLLSRQVSHSLRRLVIGAHGLCQFFGWLEHHTPGTLPHNLRLLREVDLCFRIDDRPAGAVPGTCNILADLLKIHLPSLDDVILIDNADHETQMESCLVGSAPGTFTLWRSAAIRREYESWWKSVDGHAFQAARAGNGEPSIGFDVPWTNLDDTHYRPARNQNRFANTRRPGYIFT